jgi:microcystin-dependent protein
MVGSGPEIPENAAMSDPLIGEIRMFAGAFVPRGWAPCDGRLLSISRHSALFSVMGTAYGGDGMTTFALPDLRGRVPLHPEQGPGLDQQPYTQVNFIIALDGSFPTRG